MGEVFFTSDTHFYHQPSFLWEPRGFTNVEEMNEALVENWNSVVKPEDEVYNLGDMALTDPEDSLKYLKQLNGKHWWIYGNHDTKHKINLFIDEVDGLFEIGYAWILKDIKVLDKPIKVKGHLGIWNLD